MKAIKVTTTEQAIGAVTTKLVADMNSLEQRQKGALSIFRKTAEELASVNTDLNDKVTKFNEVVHFAEEQRMNAEKMIEDNEKVRARILEIIGE